MFFGRELARIENLASYHDASGYMFVHLHGDTFYEHTQALPRDAWAAGVSESAVEHVEAVLYTVYADRAIMLTGRLLTLCCVFLGVCYLCEARHEYSSWRDMFAA